ncbi:CrcB family protein [Microbacterium sp. SLBN-146]|uniref:fluoride efflux transporter FluC n=1 Tax=Microbacterium sp. SLBN-146 TaxID=2768457 RepID=UPI00114E75CD|nr:CrcB family protein [Microbacterium sp. SLBN-146]TQJ29649.1 CrcB protein [Microbacterium sp. SLBN-146]
MNALVFVLAALGGGIGAAARFVVDAAVTRMLGTRFPWGILVVNTTGSLLLGFVTGLAEGEAAWLFVLGAGVLGGYTTFSTAIVDTVLLVERRAWGSALANALATVLVTVLAAALGLLLARAL